jgi:hypothetical protein
MNALSLLLVVVLSAGPKGPKPAAPTPAKPDKPAAASPEPAKGDDDAAAARKYFTWALSLYKQARYSEAIGKFEEAYRLKPAPSIFFNIGRCYEQLGDLPRALKNYRDYLRIAPEAKDRELVTDAIANLERRLKEQGVQQVTVLTEPSGARVSVDERYLGISPITMELKPGNHVIGLTREGFEAVQKSILLSAEKSMELSVSLQPTKVAAAVKPVVAPVLTPRAEVVKPVAPAVAPQRTVTWLVGAIGVAAIGAGVAMGVLANASSATLRGSLHDGPTAQALYDRTSSLGLGANIAYISGAVTLVAAVILFFVEPNLGGAAPPKAVASAP